MSTVLEDSEAGRLDSESLFFCFPPEHTWMEELLEQEHPVLRGGRGAGRRLRHRAEPVPQGRPQLCMLPIPIMVLVLDGHSEIGAHVWSDLGYLIC